MSMQEEKTNSYVSSAHATGWSDTLKRGQEQATPEQPPPTAPAPAPEQPPPTAPAPAPEQPQASAPVQATTQEQPDWNTLGRQDARITAILRQMSIGHLVLGIALTVAGAFLEGMLQQSAFFGLAASGAILSACGMITLLAINRQQANPSALGFYLLPYADFAIVGLWLLLFGAASPVLLFYAYIIVSIALLLGSRHAITIAIISAATTLTVGLSQYAQQVEPAILLRDAGEFTFMVVSIVLAIVLLVYASALFSSNLDRFIGENNRQSSQLSLAHGRLTELEQQVTQEVELLNDAYRRFTSGEAQARVSALTGPHAPVGQHLNALFEQIEQLTRFANLRVRMETRVAELNAAMERLSNGDLNALQALGGPSGTSLDETTVVLVRIIRQLIDLQQALQRARLDYGAVNNLASELTMARQGLNSAATAIHELLTRSAQSAVQMRAMSDTEITAVEGRFGERPFMREMELRARQQGAGLELLHTRLEHVMAQVDATEYELRRLVEHADAAARRLPRPTLPINPPPEQMGMLPSGAHISPGSGPIPHVSRPAFSSGSLTTSAPVTTSTASGQIKPTEQPSRPGSGPIRAAEAPPLPRRFISPMMPAARPEQSRSEPWQAPPEASEEGANATR